MGANLCVLHRKKYDENYSAHVPKTPNKKAYAEQPKPGINKLNEQKPTNTDELKKNQEKEINDKQVLKNNNVINDTGSMIARISTSSTSSESATSTESPASSVNVLISNEIKNNVRKINSINFIDRNVNEIKNSSRRSRSIPNITVDNKIDQPDSTSFFGILRGNTSSSDISKHAFEENLHKLKKEEKKESQNNIFDNLFSAIYGTHSEDNIVALDESIANGGKILSTEHVKDSNQANGKERDLNNDEINKEIEKKNKIRAEKIAKIMEHLKAEINPKFMSNAKTKVIPNVSKSLNRSVSTNYKKEKMPPIRSNSSYFNNSGVIIYH
ncbi:conserved Plasmodium protein, unknown function [Plasmodium chabaudi chabaudi]|uniref:Uncharacterized protein n=1 Tax=Plasmodium chabaudi chabaudi TaxID=31271 RepID=A0A4V6M8Z8_PLACU|nr:conserved Plasmodium protein, unknown function [Plasmodium chabaudi chabaudi]VTZ67242.1 conserved Plasmodium protein, unknown function [Plasmodium chabaudi chabaudi]|eukprot:XP_016653302.1 conserved Plasmodium protein, unknown function [Plasmodium chabaudi chabaudi]